MKKEQLQKEDDEKDNEDNKIKKDETNNNRVKDGMRKEDCDIVSSPYFQSSNHDSINTNNINTNNTKTSNKNNNNNNNNNNSDSDIQTKSNRTMDLSKDSDSSSSSSSEEGYIVQKRNVDSKGRRVLGGRKVVPMTVAMTHSKAMQQQTKNTKTKQRRNTRDDARKINGIASTRTTARKTASTQNEDNENNDDIGSISIKGLRNMAKTLNINISDCIEKREIVDRYHYIVVIVICYDCYLLLICC